MKNKTTISSKFGIVDIDLLGCDYSECNTLVQERHAIGWAQVFRLGDQLTLKSLPTETHFCSPSHLKAYLEEFGF